MPCKPAGATCSLPQQAGAARHRAASTMQGAPPATDRSPAAQDVDVSGQMWSNGNVETGLSQIWWTILRNGGCLRPDDERGLVLVRLPLTRCLLAPTALGQSGLP